METKASAQEEIQRLNRIIANLLKQVEVLKQDNSDLRIDTGIKSKNNSSVIYDNGIKSKNNSRVIYDNGIKSKNNSSVIYDNSIKNKNNATIIYDNGMKNKNKESIADLLPAIELSHSKFARLGERLRAYFHIRISGQSLHAIAHELLLLYNNGTARYEELRKASQLSSSGFSKHFPMLKRKGFICKKGVKQYGLTVHAKALIEEEFTNQ